MADQKERRSSLESRAEDRGVITEKLGGPLSDSESIASVELASGEKHDAAAAAHSQSHRPRQHGDGSINPDIDHEEVEGAVPGHELDVELAQVS